MNVGPMSYKLVARMGQFHTTQGCK